MNTEIDIFETKIKDLTQLIDNLEICLDIQDKGLLLNQCSKFHNELLEIIKQEQYNKLKIQRKNTLTPMSKRIQANKLKQRLDKITKAYLQEAELQTLVQDSIKLNDMLNNRFNVPLESIKKLGQMMRENAERVDTNSLKARERKLYEDAIKLIRIAINLNKQDVIVMSQSSNHFESIYNNVVDMREIRKFDQKDETAMIQILKDVGEMRIVSSQISRQITIQAEQLDIVQMNELIAHQKVSQAEDEMIIAHSQMMRRRRKILLGIFAVFFSTISSIQGFGCLIGGFFGFKVGNKVANITQGGIQDKIEKKNSQ